MGWSLTIGGIAGTDIRLHFTFLLFLIWIGVTDYLMRGAAAALDTVVFILLVFLCVTLHEFGHIAMARRFGIKTPQVVLSPIGGIASLERMPEKPKQELLVAIAGPLVNVVIALLLMAGFGIGLTGIDVSGFDTATLAERLLVVNVVLVLFNMVPAFPMDGGRVLRALLAMNMGMPKATALAARIGRAKARHILLHGKSVAIAEAERIGLVDLVVPDDELAAAALAEAEALAAQPPHAFRLAKRILTEAPTTLDALLDAELNAQTLSYVSPEHKEGIAAFQEKRKPRF